MKRQGPVSGTGASAGFTRRVKPFYMCTEKEVMVYSFLNGLNTEFNECPNVAMSFRLRIRDMLNEIEAGKPGTKKNIVEWFIDFKKKAALSKGDKETCKACGEPSAKEVCSACRLAEEICA